MSTFGWQLVSHSSSSSTSSDELVAFVHWRLLVHGLRVVGVGDDFDEDASKYDEMSFDQVAKETLPDTWKERKSVYGIKYIDKKANRLVLKAMTAGNELIVTLISHNTNKEPCVLAKLSLVTNEEIEENKDIKSVHTLATKIDRSLLNDLITDVDSTAPKSKPVDVLTEKAERPSKSRLLDEQCDDPRRHLPRAPLGSDPIRGLGAADLDPLGRFGPGMIVDPTAQGRLPMPMPQFDPAYPGQRNPGLFGRNNEDSFNRRNFGDAMAPPKFNDSMFM